MCTYWDSVIKNVVWDKFEVTHLHDFASAPSIMYLINYTAERNTPWESAERVESGPMLDAYYSGLPHLMGIPIRSQLYVYQNA